MNAFKPDFLRLVVRMSIAGDNKEPAIGSIILSIQAALHRCNQ
jgi:hypothetical protein